MQLLIGDISLPVAQMARDHVYLDDPIDMPPGKVTLVLHVDGREQRWEVLLPKGISAKSNIVPLAASAQ